MTAKKHTSLRTWVSGLRRNKRVMEYMLVLCEIWQGKRNYMQFQQSDPMASENQNDDEHRGSRSCQNLGESDHVMLKFSSIYSNANTNFDL